MKKLNFTKTIIYNMNLFILSQSVSQTAEWMFDKHIVKIILEAAQILSCCKRILDTDISEEESNKIYKLTHRNHPINVWIRESYANYCYVLDLSNAMHNEWRYRYNHPDTKFHKAYLIIMYLKENPPPLEKFPQKVSTPFVLAMPEQYKTQCPYQSYRNYYNSPEKQKIASWKKRNTPEWFNK